MTQIPSKWCRIQVCCYACENYFGTNNTVPQLSWQYLSWQTFYLHPKINIIHVETIILLEPSSIFISFSVFYKHTNIFYVLPSIWKHIFDTNQRIHFDWTIFESNDLPTMYHNVPIGNGTSFWHENVLNIEFERNHTWTIERRIRKNHICNKKIDLWVGRQINWNIGTLICTVCVIIVVVVVNQPNQQTVVNRPL